jgi:hypothetical protein
VTWCAGGMASLKHTIKHIQNNNLPFLLRLKSATMPAPPPPLLSVLTPRSSDARLVVDKVSRQIRFCVLSCSLAEGTDTETADD